MIRMNDFKSEPADLRSMQIEAAKRVIESGWYVLGNEVRQFESAWSETCGSARCVGIGNGMDAIEIGLRAIGIGVGDEVITTPMTAFASVLAIIRAGATPVMADISPDSALLDMASVQRSLSPRTRAVLLVHLYGQIGDMRGWSNFCGQSGIHLIEDCAQSHLARWDGKVAGTHGKFGAYSFYPTKNLGGLGDGGAIVTDDPAVADQCAKLRNYGQGDRYHHELIGLNSRLDEMQAALLVTRLRWLNEFTDRRRQIAHAYRSGIRNSAIEMMAPPAHPENHVYHLFVVLCDQRDKLAGFLKESGVETLVHYPVPIHRQKPCVDIARDPRGLPAAEVHAARCLSVPCHPQMSDADVSLVIDALNAFRA
jgi:dTDP-4-amino-4,6-dideoxygalactose transaminase